MSYFGLGQSSISERGYQGHARGRNPARHCLPGSSPWLTRLAGLRPQEGIIELRDRHRGAISGLR